MPPSWIGDEKARSGENAGGNEKALTNEKGRS